MPHIGVIVQPDGSMVQKMVPTQQEIEENWDYRYKNAIWKHKIFGSKIRTTGWSNNFINNFAMEQNVYFIKADNTPSRMLMAEFDYLYEFIGKCKYEESQLNKMKFELKEDNDV